MLIMTTNTIQLTGPAIQRIRALMTGKHLPPSGGLRVAVVGGGCSGMSYKMDLDKEPTEKDRVVEQDGVRIFIDPKSFVYLTGLTMDYVDTVAQSGFVFSNPNAKQ